MKSAASPFFFTREATTIESAVDKGGQSTAVRVCAVRYFRYEREQSRYLLSLSKVATIKDKQVIWNLDILQNLSKVQMVVVSSKLIGD